MMTEVIVVERNVYKSHNVLPSQAFDLIALMLKGYFLIMKGLVSTA